MLAQKLRTDSVALHVEKYNIISVYNKVLAAICPAASTKAPRLSNPEGLPPDLCYAVFPRRANCVPKTADLCKLSQNDL